MKIDIIIPNYNGADLINQNLPKVIAALSQYDGKIIIVDDASTIDERERLESIVSKVNKNGHQVILIQKSRNSGFSSTINVGVENSTAEFVVLLNSDVNPKSDFLKSPLELLSDDENLFGVGCMDESVEGAKTVFRGRGLAHWSKGFLHHSRGEVNQSDTFWISGGSCIIRRELLNKFGGMDTIYSPFYWEDIDLSYRAQKAGYKILFDPLSIVEHRHSEGAIKKHYTSSRVTTISYRNQFIFVWKNITSRKLLLDHFIHLPSNLISALLRSDWPFIKGFFLAMLLLPAIIGRRKKQTKLYKLSDTQVIKKVS